MKTVALVGLALASGAGVLALGGSAGDQAVTLTNQPAGHRVDVLVNGQPFTSYVYSSLLEKPVLYPLRSARGTIVTRGFPLEPRPGERHYYLGPPRAAPSVP